MSEHAEQSMVIEWARYNEQRYPALKLLHAVQNWAGVKSAREGARRKAEGVKAGVPDLHLPVPRCGFASLYIEMKTERIRPRKSGGVSVRRTKPTKAQRAWHKALREAGNAVEVCWSAEEAHDVLRAYLEGEYGNGDGEG